jgi:predicted metalloprotease with PDZ domain
MVRIFIAFVILIGCSSEVNKPYWEEGKMVTVLADLRLIDHYIKQHLLSQRDSVRTLYRDLLEEIHKVTEEDIEYHLNYVQSDPNIAKELEEKVQKLLHERLKILQNYQ